MSHTPPRCGVCSHRIYLMSCDDFDAFDAEYGDRCAICNKVGRETGHGYLNIDHDANVGDWAVRGRLCTSCNTRIGDGVAQTPEDAEYLASPWYQRRFTALGISFTLQPEPGVGAIVAIRRERMQYWRRSEAGWQRANGRSQLRTWRELNRRHGPHHIQVMSDQATVTVRFGRILVGNASS